MVYCGKPSKGCQMCRSRRIKCDETKPTCNQCAKARRQCPGYKDEFDLVLRDENQAAKRRALKLTTPRRKGSASASAASLARKSSKSSLASSSSSSSSSSSAFSPAPSPTSPGGGSRTTTATTSPNPPSPYTQQHQHPPQGQGQSQGQGQGQDHEHDAAAYLALSPTPLHIPPESLAPCHFVANFVLVPRQDGTRGFLDYLLPLMQQQHERGGGISPGPTTTPGGRGLVGKGVDDDLSHLRHAFNACALASLGNRSGPESSSSFLGGEGGSVGVGIPGVAGYGRVAGGGCLGKAFGEYSRALRATQAALVDPERWRSDGVLAAVLLLGMFENITAKKLGSLAWGSHIEGAIQLVKARGRSQLRTKMGMQLFIAVRTQLIIHTLASGTAPAMGADWWIDDAIVDSTAAECQRLSLKAGEVRAHATRIMATAARTPENIQLVRSLMQQAMSLDERTAAWMDAVPEAWRFKTLCWHVDNLGSGDYANAEVFPGRVDVYSDYWVAGVWNQARTTRLVLMSVAVRCAAWVCSPVDYRTTPEYATAARVCVDTISDIIASIPFHCGWHAERGDLFDQPNGFGCGDERAAKGLAGYLLTWPLACVMTQDYSTDAQRAYTRGRLKHIGDGLGIKYAHILSHLHVRVPSMLIRSDGLVAKPYPMAYNFEKLLSSARPAGSLPQGYTLSHLSQSQQQDVPQQQQQPQQSQGGPAGASGEAMRPVMQKWAVA